MMKKFGNVFHGWWEAIAGAILAMFGYGAWQYSFGNFLGPISTEFGWSRAKTSLAFSFGRVEGGIEGPIVGPLVDKYGPRFMIRVAWTMTALGFFLLYFMNSYLMFILCYTVLITIGMNAGLYMSLQKAVLRWFDKRRGLALGVLGIGGGLGGATWIPLTAWLITNYGWRKAAFFLAIAAAVLGWGVGYVIKPHGPEHYGLSLDGEKIEPTKVVTSPGSSPVGEESRGIAEGLSLKEAMKTRNFWLLAIAFSAHNAIVGAISVHQVPFLEDMGVSKILAATALGSTLLMGLPGRVCGGWLADRWNPKYLYSIAAFTMATGILIFTRITGPFLMWLFVVIFGLGWGLRVPLDPFLRTQCFGKRSFATIYGYINIFTAVGGFVGPFFAGWLYDTTGSYVAGFLICATMLLVASIVVLFIKSPVEHRRHLGGT